MDSAEGSSKGNAASIIFSLKNYYPQSYRDRKEIAVESATTIVIDTGIHRPELAAPVKQVVNEAIEEFEEPLEEFLEEDYDFL